MSMPKKNSNTYKVCILASSNLLLQILGFVYRMMLTDLAGTEALGLQSLVMQVYSIAVSICISGMNVAVTTMAARLAARGSSSIRRLAINSFRIYLALFFLMAIPMFSFRNAIAERMIGDASSARSLVLILVCIFMTGIENLLKSIHHGVGRVRPTAVSELMEQSARFILVFLLLSNRGESANSETVFLIILGMVFSEFVSVGLLFASYMRKFGRERPAVIPSLTHDLTGILVPAAFTGLASTIFASAASLLLPNRLMLAGYTRGMALSTLGMLNSVAVPLVMPPMAFVGAVGTVSLPAVSAAAFEGNRDRLRILIGKSMYAALSAACCINFAFLPFLQQLSYLLFGMVPRMEIFILLSIKAAIIYFQIVSAAVLNGLKRQRLVLIYAVIGEVTQLILIYVLSAISSLHIYGYLISMSIGEFIRLMLSFAEIKRTLGIWPLSASDSMLPTAIGAILYLYSKYAVGSSKLIDAQPLLTAAHVAAICLLGMVCAFLMRTIKTELHRCRYSPRQ